MIKEKGVTPRPDVRKVYSFRWDNGVQVTFGKLPWEWGPSEDWWSYSEKLAHHIW